jgi:hypothetical protein
VRAIDLGIYCPTVNENIDNINVAKNAPLLPKYSIKNIANKVEARTRITFSHILIVEKKLSGEERKSLKRIAHFLFSFFALRTLIFPMLIRPVSLAVKIP